MNKTLTTGTLEYAKMITENFIDPETESLTEQLYMHGNQPWKEIAKFSQTKRGAIMENIASFMLKSNNIEHTTQVHCPKNCDCCKFRQKYIVDFQLKNNVNIELKTCIYSCLFKKNRGNLRTKFQNPDLQFQNVRICSQNPYSYIWLMTLPHDSHEIKSWLVPYKDWHMFATTQERKSNNYLKYKGLRVVNNNGNTISSLSWRKETPDWLAPYEGLENNLAYLSRLYGQNGQIGQACA